ncbi:MAG: hypothetical protein ACREJC_08480 [Tepidisphaeraceae bacterium]
MKTSSSRPLTHSDGAGSCSDTDQQSLSALSLLEYDLGFGESIGIDINYRNMTIALVPEPASLGVLAVALPMLARRRTR